MCYTTLSNSINLLCMLSSIKRSSSSSEFGSHQGEFLASFHISSCCIPVGVCLHALDASNFFTAVGNHIIIKFCFRKPASFNRVLKNKSRAKLLGWCIRGLQNIHTELDYKDGTLGCKLRWKPSLDTFFLTNIIEYHGILWPALLKYPLLLSKVTGNWCLIW